MVHEQKGKPWRSSRVLIYSCWQAPGFGPWLPKNRDKMWKVLSSGSQYASAEWRDGWRLSLSEVLQSCSDGLCSPGKGLRILVWSKAEMSAQFHRRHRVTFHIASDNADVSDVPLCLCVSVRESWINRTNTAEQIKGWDYSAAEQVKVRHPVHALRSGDYIILPLSWTSEVHVLLHQE